MEYVYTPHMIESTKKKKTYYFVSIDLVDSQSKECIQKGQPILWLTEEQYKKMLGI